MSSSVTHFVAHVRISSLLLVIGYFSCFYIWLLGIILLWTLVHRTFLSPYFQPFRHGSRNGIAGSYGGNSVFNYFRNRHTVLHNGCTFMFLPAMHKGAKPSPTSTFTFCRCYFIKAVLLSVKWYLIVVRNNGRFFCCCFCFLLWSILFIFPFSQIKYTGVTLVNKIV